jgi:hypothetical protein
MVSAAPEKERQRKMSEQITEERIKMILSKREKMLRDRAFATITGRERTDHTDINEKVILLIKDLDRIDDDLITEKSIHAVSINMMPSAQGGVKKDLSDLIIKLQRDREERKNELYKMIRLLSDQEYMINRVWACFLALDDPYYTMLNQLYVENDLYEAVRQQFDMSPTTFERHRKKALTLIAEYVDSQLSVSEIMSMSHSNKPTLNSRAPTHDMPGQIDMMDFLYVPDSGT